MELKRRTERLNQTINNIYVSYVSIKLHSKWYEITDRQTQQVNHILDDNYLILNLKNISNHRVALLLRIKVDFPSCNVYHTSNS